MLKHVKRHEQQELEEVKKDIAHWADVSAKLKKEKKKLEYTLHDLWKFSNGTKEKLKKIRQLCDEGEC